MMNPGVTRSQARLGGVIACFCMTVSIAFSGPTIEVPAGQRQLFLDDYVVAELAGLKRTLHRPRKSGAVIRSAAGETIQIRTAPVWDAEANVYKLWLLSTQRPLWISADGLHWTPGPVPNLRTDHVVYDPLDLERPDDGVVLQDDLKERDDRPVVPRNDPKTGAKEAAPEIAVDERSMDLLLDVLAQLDVRQLQQFDRLLQLRRHNQGLGLSELEALGYRHDGKP